jgi:uncharacterized membrane protein
MNKRYKQLWTTIGSMGLLAVIFDTFPTLMRSIDYFLQSKQLTAGAVLMMMVPFFMILSKLSKEKEKRRRSLHIEMTQQRMERNQKKIMDHWGIEGEWVSNLQQNGSEITQTPTSTIFYTFLHSLKNLNLRRKKIMERLKSRKFWMAILAVIIPVINSEFGINLDTPTIIGILSAILGYIAVQGHVDAKKVQNGGSTDAKPTGDSGAAV